MKSGILFGCNPIIYIYVKLNIYIYIYVSIFLHICRPGIRVVCPGKRLSLFSKAFQCLLWGCLKISGPKGQIEINEYSHMSYSREPCFVSGPKRVFGRHFPNVEAEVSMGVTMDSHCDDSRPCKAIEPGPRR